MGGKRQRGCWLPAWSGAATPHRSWSSRRGRRKSWIDSQFCGSSHRSQPREPVRTASWDPSTGAQGEPQLRPRRPRLLPLRHLRRSPSGRDRPARRDREALQLRHLDGPLALQHPHRPDAACLTQARLRLRSLPARVRTLRRAPGHHRHRLRPSRAAPLPADVAARRARLLHPRARFDAGPQPRDRDQQGLRQLSPDGCPQRLSRHARIAEVLQPTAVVLSAEPRRDSLPLRHRRRGSGRVADGADLAGQDEPQRTELCGWSAPPR